MHVLIVGDAAGTRGKALAEALQSFTKQPEERSAPAACDICGDPPASMRCEECDKVYCDEECFSAAHRKGARKTHQHIAIGEQGSGGGDSVVQLPMACVGDYEFHVFPVGIKTKYYEASVELWIDVTSGSVGTDGLKRIDDAAAAGDWAGLEGISEGCEGVIFVCDVHSESSFEKTKQWVGFTEEYGIELKLLIGEGGDTPTKSSEAQKEHRMQQRIIWCLVVRTCKVIHPRVCVVFIILLCALQEYELEYAEIDSSVSLEVFRESDNQREKEGLPRLIEAMQCHMWSDMQVLYHRTFAAHENESHCNRYFTQYAGV